MRVSKKRRARQLHTLGAAIEMLERRLVLDADLAPWVQEYMQPYQDEEESADDEPVPGPIESPTPCGLFEGVDSKTNFQSYLGIDPVPPDPSFAPGPNHVVATVNSTIRWWNKAGTIQNSQNLGSGFGTAFFAPLNPADFTTDSKVIYDQYAGRFVVEALEVIDTPTTLSSRVMVAASDDSDPNGTWYFTSINTKMTINGFDRWLDYPTLGIDNQAIYIGGNMFGFNNNPFGQNQYVGSRLIIIDKNGFYSGGPATSNIYDPSALAGKSFELFTPQPAHMYGATPSGVGTFLVASGLADSQGNDLLGIIKINNPLSSPTFTYSEVPLGNITIETGFLPEAPQPGTTTKIDQGDQRLMNAVWRNNALWTTGEINPPAGTDRNQTTAHWYKISADGVSAPTLSQQGSAGGEDIATGAYTYFPSINVNANGDMAMQVSLSSPATYPGAYYVARQVTDPPNQVQSTAVIAAGQDYYVKTNSGIKNRWGDFSATEVDPTDDTSFWLYGEFALTREPYNPNRPTQDGHWGTRAAVFSFVGTLGISGQVYTDANGNGTFDVGEATINGVTVFLDNNDNGTLDASEPFYTSGGSGNFVFTGLANGTYHLRQVQPPGYIRSSTAADVTIAGASVVSNIGNFPTNFPLNLAVTGPRNFSVSLAPSGTIEQINDGTTTYTIDKSKLASTFVQFNGAINDDTLKVDLTNGIPTPLVFSGSGQISADTIAIIGSSGVESVTVNSSLISYGANLTYIGTESVTFDGAGGGDNVTVNSGTLELSSTQVLSSVTVAGGTLRLRSGGNKILVADTLNVTGSGVLDLTDEDAIVRSGNLSTIGTLLANGYAGGLWNGTGGIKSSTAAVVAASASTFKTALGFANASATTLGSSFDGQILNSDDVVIRYTDSGDANLDGAVNTADFNALAINFNSHTNTWAGGDFSFNGVVNALDFNSIATNFGQALPVPAPISVFSPALIRLKDTPGLLDTIL